MTGQTLIPYKGVVTDANPLYINDQQSPYLKNVENFDSLGVFTPVYGNEPFCNLALPVGRNIVMGSHNVKELSHTYVFVWNSRNEFCIYRLKGNQGNCEMVSVSSCWNFQLDPKHFISYGRCASQVTTRFNHITGFEEKVTYLIFTDNFNPIRFICVEDVIATGGFTTPFFANTGANQYRCDWYNLGVPTPLDCIKITPVTREVTIDESTKANIINFKGIEFRIKQTNVWGQDSEHGKISDQYISTTSLCIQNSSGLSRCLKLNFKAGSPLISKIQVEFRVSKGKARGLSVASDWFLYDTIECYDNSINLDWYNRPRNNPWQKEYDAQMGAGLTAAAAAAIADKKSLLKYNSIDNSFDYTFCGNKAWTAIAVEETNRFYNPIPITAGTVFSLFKNFGTGRHKKGFAPIEGSQIEKISYPVTQPASQAACSTKLRKIVVYALLYDPFIGGIPMIFRKDKNADSHSLYGRQDGGTVNGLTRGQYFPLGQDGFIGYLAGTSNYAVSSQYSYRISTKELLEVGVEYPDAPFGFSDDLIPIQRFEFDAVPGKYLFRVANQKAAQTDKYADTSTQFAGQLTGAIGPVINNSAIKQCKELIVDACTGDVDLIDKPAVIYDLTYGQGYIGCGYLYEDEDEKRPLENANVDAHASGQFGSITTDYNGFYWAATIGTFGGIPNFDIKGRKNGLANQVLGTASMNGYTEKNFYVYKLTNKYPDTDRILIKGKISLCGSPDVGVAGVSVAATNCRPVTTDSSGNFTIVTHDNGDNKVRIETLIYMQKGVCKIVSCTNNCEYCFPNQTLYFPIWNNRPDRTIIIPTLTVQIKGLNLKGPTMGGRYQLGFAVENWLGQWTYVQTSEKHFIDVPTLQETKTFDYSKIGFNIPSDFRLPSWARNMTFFITDNLNQDDFMTWTVDRLQYIDGAGNDNKESPAFLRLYYESLGEFNKLHKFSTTTAWQFITADAAPVVGDQIEILANGDGTILSQRTSTLVSYDAAGQYVQIEYNDDLKDLKEGALIKLIRPVQGETAQFFYELCPTIKVSNGAPEVLTGTFTFADSYLLNRQIPVPIAKKTTKNASGAVIETDENINELRSYPFLFEHPSPSDFWGDHCRGRGRVNVKNIYENAISANTEVALTKALANDGVLNGLHYFTDTDFTQFDENEWGGIVAIIPELNYVMVICERDNFVVGYNDNTLRFDSKTGKAYAASADDKFGRPERKVGNNYGCDMSDIGSIQKHDGRVAFVDRSKNAIVFHNYSEGQDVTLNLNKGWIEEKIDLVCHTPGKYFVSGIDPRKSDYLLSTFDIKASYTDQDFINDLPEADAQKNETVAIDLVDRSFVYMSFVPENYALVVGDACGTQFVTFKQGKAFKHNNTSTPYMNFFGIQCKPRIWGVANIENTKEKKYASIEVYCKEVNFVAYKVLTESGQVSRIKKTWWDKAETFYKAPFLCDLNTLPNKNLQKATGVNKILDGDLLYGLWLIAAITTTDADDGKFFEYTGMIIFANPSEKSSR